MKSIRSYLVLSILSLMTLTSFATALYGYRHGVEEAERVFDRRIVDMAALIIQLYQGGATMPPLPLPASQENLAFQVWREPETLVARSSVAPRKPIAVFREGFHDENFSGRRWRILVTRIEKDGDWLMVAERADLRYLLADRVAMQTVRAAALALPLAAVLAWVIVGHGMQLLRRLAGELQDKRADDLSRVEIGDPPSELAPVVQAVNGLLDRLALSLAREQRLTADAAHELRTPIASLKMHIYNLRGRLPAADPALAHLTADVGRLEHVVEQILTLYRITPEHYQAAMAPVDLAEIARQAIAEGYSDFAARKQTISLDGQALAILGDRFALAVLVKNLLSNASKYSPSGATITVRLSVGKDRVTLGVHDSGPGIPAAEADRVFERFYRLGGDRHDSMTEGAGLGLSIVALVAELHGAKIRLHNEPAGGGFSVLVDFPRQSERHDTDWQRGGAHHVA